MKLSCSTGGSSSAATTVVASVPAQPAAATTTSLTQLYKNVSPGVVDIVVNTSSGGFGDQGAQAEGSGFVVDTSGSMSGQPIAQAIAALAFGTETVPRVDRIVGPGNIYVAAAKKLVAGETGIDFIAGPTEIVIIAAEGNARWIAADMLAQAEHDLDASAVLLTTSRKLAEAVALEVERQLETLPTASVARPSIDQNGAIVIVDAMDQAVEFSNALAPEHLALHDPRFLGSIHNAGSVFLGPASPEAAGDYASGPNHVLPTSGAARLRGGLSSADFVKVISIQELSPAALAQLTPAITTLARAEGLEAHARSVEARRDG